MLAVKLSDIPIAKLLINRGADINAENYAGETALNLAIAQGHAEFDRDQTITEYDGSTLIVYMLLVAGAHLHKTSSVDMEKAEGWKPNPYILKLLSVGGANNEHTRMFSSENLLEDYATDCIRECLKQCNPESNLYHSVQQLQQQKQLPNRLHSQLLKHTVLNLDRVLNNEEKVLLQKTREGDTACVQYLIDHKVTG